MAGIFVFGESDQIAFSMSACFALIRELKRKERKNKHQTLTFLSPSPLLRASSSSPPWLMRATTTAPLPSHPRHRAALPTASTPWPRSRDRCSFACVFRRAKTPTAAFSLRFPANHSPFGETEATTVLPMKCSTKALKKFQVWPPAAAAVATFQAVFRPTPALHGETEATVEIVVARRRKPSAQNPHRRSGRRQPP